MGIQRSLVNVCIQLLECAADKSAPLRNIRGEPAGELCLATPSHSRLPPSRTKHRDPPPRLHIYRRSQDFELVDARPLGGRCRLRHRWTSCSIRSRRQRRSTSRFRHSWLRHRRHNRRGAGHERRICEGPLPCRQSSPGCLEQCSQCAKDGIDGSSRSSCMHETEHVKKSMTLA